MKKFIDLETGNIQFEQGFIVKENDSIEYVQSLKLGQESHVDDMKTGWVWLRERHIPFDEWLLSIRFAFYKNQLKEAHYSIGNANGTIDSTPENIYYSRNYQLALHEQDKKWFKKYVGNSGNYPWGSVICGYSEVREPDAYMFVKYKT